MGLIRILLWLGYSLMGSAGLMVIGAAVGLIMREVEEAALMAILATVSALVGVLMATASFRASNRESSAEAILFLMLFWIIVPIICALPFYVLGASSNPIAAVFESVSAMTTTGASTLDPDLQSHTILFWRSLLQFAGGVSVAIFAVVILAALNLSGMGIHQSSLFSFRSGELFQRFLAVGRIVSGVYLMLAGIGFTLMLMSGTDMFTALCLALSGISTGGLQPVSGPLANFLSPISAIILSLLCLFGAFNISVIWEVLRQRRLRMALRLLTHVEHRGLLFLAGLLILITIIFASVYNLGPAVLDAIFFVSSAGYRYDVISLDMVPAPILIAIALIGGSALSTAGGIKIIRLLLLFRHLGTDLARLSHPSRVKPIEFRARVVDDDAFLSIWMYFFGYSLCFATGALALTAAGLDLQDAIASSAASLANIGPLLDLTLPASGLRYSDFTGTQMTLSAMLMLAGRVEVLVALSLLIPSNWRQ